MSISWPDDIDEIRYLLWQTDHGAHALGRVNGYYPPSRLRAQGLVEAIPSKAFLTGLRELGATHLVWHSRPHIQSEVEGRLAIRTQISNLGTTLPIAVYRLSSPTEECQQE